MTVSNINRSYQGPYYFMICTVRCRCIVCRVLSHPLSYLRTVLSSVAHTPLGFSLLVVCVFALCRCSDGLLVDCINNLVLSLSIVLSSNLLLFLRSRVRVLLYLYLIVVLFRI